jgi:hypothetical protein
MAFIDDLRGWFEHDIRFATWDENVKVDDSDPNRISIQFYTDTNEYQLLVISEGNEHHPYVDIEATVRARKARAGQAAPRARRLLPAGRNPPNLRSWRRILGGIVGLELVRVHRGGAGTNPNDSDPDGVARARAGASDD